MTIWFDIDPKNGAPIFKQIIDQVKRAIATGLLKPDEQLPTVRELAEEHSLNPNTIAKAYQGLELMGLVYTRPGVRGGTFIAKGVVANVRETELERFQDDLRRTVHEGYNLGLPQAELERRFQQELEQWYTTHPLPAPATIEGVPDLANQVARKLYTRRSE